VIRVLVDGLPITNLSGRHVVMGHLAHAALATAETHRWIVLYHRANADLRCDLGSHVIWKECPSWTVRWMGRRAWQNARLRAVAEEVGADVVLSPSGTLLPRVAVPQVVYAMNPWALADGLDRTPTGSAKAALQRRAYARAVRGAAAFLFLSEYLREAYRANAGVRERASEVAYPGIDDDVFGAAARSDVGGRSSDQVVCASVMAAHKGVETVVEAVAELRAQGVGLRLVLAGPWPDDRYARRILRLIEERGLGSAVTVTGHLRRPDLHRLYRQSRLFALMSRTESFGIPAAEAQAYGTPVVSSDTGAIREVCGAGGLYPPVGDVRATAETIGSLLSDDRLWRRTSEAARENARRFQWSRCAPAFLRGIELGLGPAAECPGTASSC